MTNPRTVLAHTREAQIRAAEDAVVASIPQNLIDNMNDELPPMPEPWIYGGVLHAPIEGTFTAGQMRSYARAAIAADRARGAEPVAWAWHYPDGRICTLSFGPNVAVPPGVRARPLVFGDTPPAAVPAGWKLVPIEPTVAMMDAVDTSGENPSTARSRAYSAWMDMLAAAPQPGDEK